MTVRKQGRASPCGRTQMPPRRRRSTQPHLQRLAPARLCLRLLPAWGRGSSSELSCGGKKCSTQDTLQNRHANRRTRCRTGRANVRARADQLPAHVLLSAQAGWDATHT